MKRLMISLLGAFAFAATAQAQAVQTPAQDTQATTQTAQQDKKADASDPICLHSTGSHIRHIDTRRRDKCTEHGRAYSRDDVQRTGEINLADALRKLDPSIH